MKKSILLLFIVFSSAAFSQQSPFTTSWKWQDTTTNQESLVSIKLDSLGRVFLTLAEAGAPQHIILDENGNQIGSSAYSFDAVAKSGNYYHWFNITDTGSVFTSIVIEKVSIAGNLLWRDTIGSGNNLYDYIFELHTSGEEIIATGWSTDIGVTKTFVLKLNQTGGVEWNSGIDNELPGPLIFLSSGNYLLQGHHSVISITAGGQILWQTIMNWPYDPVPSGLVEGNNGDSYVLTTSTDFNNPYGNQFVIVDHLDVNGAMTSGTNYFYDENIGTPRKDSKGNLVISTWIDHFGETDYLILRKIDSALQVNWKEFTYEDWDENVDLVLDSNDHAYWLTTSDEGYAILIKFNTDGILEWKIKKYGISTNVFTAWGLDLRKEQELLVVGVDGHPFQNSTVYLEAIALDSTTKWVASIDTIPNPSYASMIKLDDENYYLAGKYYGPSVSQGRYCVKIHLTDSLGAVNITQPDNDGMRCNVYPNPVSTSAVVSFFLNQSSDISIELLDVNGRALSVIANRNFSTGNHELTFNRESLNAGIYFLQMKTSQGAMMRKVVLE
jgi:hypothetical protein